MAVKVSYLIDWHSGGFVWSGVGGVTIWSILSAKLNQIQKESIAVVYIFGYVRLYALHYQRPHPKYQAQRRYGEPEDTLVPMEFVYDIWFPLAYKTIQKLKYRWINMNLFSQATQRRCFAFRYNPELPSCRENLTLTSIVETSIVTREKLYKVRWDYRLLSSFNFSPYTQKVTNKLTFRTLFLFSLFL